mmetsp:Transcript_32368/g.80206  ORF Transcript_32368/g.80206 Transcript_32368/m.80206 type:complete len:218 (+) Transcript_32368:959-1612(+)
MTCATHMRPVCAYRVAPRARRRRAAVGRRRAGGPPHRAHPAGGDAVEHWDRRAHRPPRCHPLRLLSPLARAERRLLPTGGRGDARAPPWQCGRAAGGLSGEARDPRRVVGAGARGALRAAARRPRARARPAALGADRVRQGGGAGAALRVPRRRRILRAHVMPPRCYCRARVTAHVSQRTCVGGGRSTVPACDSERCVRKQFFGARRSMCQSARGTM